MVFNRFALLLVFRVALLGIVLTGLSLSLITPGYYAVTLLLTLVTAALVFDLYRHVSRTNAELRRFLDAARYGDFGQRFQPQVAGAGFESLSAEFGEILQHFRESRQQQEERLRHLESLTAHSPVPLISLYPDGRIQSHNNAARRLFAGANVTRLEELSEFGRDLPQAIGELEPGRRRLVSFSCDGVDRQLSVQATQIVTGPVRECLISLQDIQSELDSAQLQAWQDLVRVLTHEIMNSITPVASLAKTAADLLGDARNGLWEDAAGGSVLEALEEARSAVDTVVRRSDGLVQFVQSYRSLAQLPAPQKKPLSALDLLRGVSKLTSVDWAQKGIHLTIDAQPEDLQFAADPELIEQVLLNLLNNAEQALDQCATPRVTMTARLSQRGRVILEVADNGPGIPAEIADRVFLPFFTTKRRGSGVGLALVRQIMLAHGGSVTGGKSDSGGAKLTLIL